MAMAELERVMGSNGARGAFTEHHGCGDFAYGRSKKTRRKVSGVQSSPILALPFRAQPLALPSGPMPGQRRHYPRPHRSLA
jgi:hypothetical protein